jgi:hypothetical protein
MGPVLSRLEVSLSQIIHIKKMTAKEEMYDPKDEI